MMKRFLMIFAVALTAGICAFALMRSQQASSRQGQSLLESMPELAWLRDELDLTDRQFVEISRLHADYLPKCKEMCHRIAEAHEKLDQASRGKKELSEELETAIKNHARIHAECQEKMLGHLYETAAVLDEKQAQNYLDLMLPYALDFSHSEPDDVHVK